MSSFSITLTNMDTGSNFTVGVEKPLLLKAPLQGWGRADIRTSSFNNSGSDGGQITTQNYGMRQIPLNFYLVADTCDGHEEIRQLIDRTLPIRQDIQVTLTTPGGKVYGSVARVIDVDPVIIDSLRSEYVVELRSGDALLYDYTGGSALKINVDKAKAGGFTLPVTLPIVFRGGSLPSVVSNTGTVTVKPIITLTGSAIDPIITNTTTSQFIKLNLTMVEGDEVVINTARHTVTLNGGNIRNAVTPLSEFWYVVPGDNLIKLESTSQADTVMAEIKWFNGYLSI